MRRWRGRKYVLYSIQVDLSTLPSPALRLSYIIRIRSSVSSTHLISHAELRRSRPRGRWILEWLGHAIASLRARKVTYKQYQVKTKVLHTNRRILRMKIDTTTWRTIARAPLLIWNYKTLNMLDLLITIHVHMVIWVNSARPMNGTENQGGFDRYRLRTWR